MVLTHYRIVNVVLYAPLRIGLTDPPLTDSELAKA